VEQCEGEGSKSQNLPAYKVLFCLTVSTLYRMNRRLAEIMMDIGLGTDPSAYGPKGDPEGKAH